MWRRRLPATLALLCAIVPLHAQSPSVVPRAALARQAFGNDAAWYLDNIPFLEIDDAEIERTYYYRWQLYRAHMREIGPQGTDETEFLPTVPWARHPFEDLNDSSSFHILEGRWMRNPAHVNALIDHLYSGGGNDRHFSESIAAATLAWTQVTGDPAPALRHLDAMRHVYNLWDDHFDAARNLYWIEPLLDATEYTISSIDASGAGFTDSPSKTNNGFFGGFAFRPTINAYQFGNAQAIAQLATLAGQPAVAADYTARAEALRAATLAQLWNPALLHFTDVYQRSTATVKAGDFIRGRELAGLVPWQFELPPNHSQTTRPAYNDAWKHALAPNELAGSFGLRTVEPTYPRYLVQYRYDQATGLRECQWNGPSWPFQTSQTLSGLANLLHDYSHPGVSAADYVHLLRQYTRQHRLADGRLDLQEDLNPDTGQPIVGLPRSHHYNHSTYIDLVLSGLLGIRPHTDAVFEMEPLLPAAGSSEPPIRFFALDGLRYHGHDLTLLFDADGTHLHQGAGLSVFSDGRLIAHTPKLAHVEVSLPPGKPAVISTRNDLAVNVWATPPSAFQTELPIASASSVAPESNLYEAIDGRQWFFPEIPHGWSPDAGQAEDTWYAVDLRHTQQIASAELAFFTDSAIYATPVGLRLQHRAGAGEWVDIPLLALARSSRQHHHHSAFRAG